MSYSAPKSPHQGSIRTRFSVAWARAVRLATLLHFTPIDMKAIPGLQAIHTGEALKYILLICGDEAAARHAGEGCSGWSEEMQRNGVLLDAAGLRPASDAITVRVRNESVQLLDGPFAETKEQVGGFCLIDCADLEEAIDVAAKHPASSYGTIEIRPLAQA